MSAVGQRIGHYEIQFSLGAGGMGEVYRAVDTRLDRPVAVKFISTQLADSSARRRFQQEARTASALNHPHILTVYDAGEVSDRQYLVTELMDGGTLDEWAHADRRTWRQIVEVLVGVADGLAAAHQAGILHRDVKPSNILLTKSGYAKLADFGLAKLDTPTTSDGVTRPPVQDATQPGQLLGTVPYMSPEQASGKALDARSDIFSFGLVLYELLAGRRAFDAKSDLDTLHAIVHDAPRPLPQDHPVGLRLAVEKAIEKDPADRYQSMRELVVDLRRELRRSGEAPATSPSTATAIAARGWVAASAAVAVLLAGGALWVFGGLAGFGARVDKIANSFADGRFTRLTDFAGDELDAAISRDGRFVAYVADRDGQFDVWMSQIGSGTPRNLTGGKDQTLPRPVGGPGFFPDGSQMWLAGGTGARLQTAPLVGGALRAYLSDRVVTLDWSPDGSRLVYHTRDATDPLFIADRDGSNARQIFAGANAGVHNHFPVWTRDGSSIVFVSGLPATNELDLWRISPNGGSPERLTTHNAVVGYPTPIDERTVVYVAGDGAGAGPWLWALDLASRSSRRISVGLEQYTSVSASADGSRLVATVANPSSNLWSVPILDRVSEERDVRPYPMPSVSPASPQFASGSLFYVSSSAMGKSLWRFRDGEAVELRRAGDDPWMTVPAISRSDGRIVIALRRSGKLRLHQLSADGAELQPLTDGLDVRGAAGWSPDGHWIVTGGSDATGDGLFKVPVDGGVPVRLATGPALDPVWSPDGGVIVYAGANVGSHAPLLAVRPDRTPISLPSIQVRREGGGSRLRFFSDGRRVIYMQGFGLAQDFWLLDLATGQTRQLTRLSYQAAMWGFDLSPDEKQIVFDRSRNASDIVLIERAPAALGR